MKTDKLGSNMKNVFVGAAIFILIFFFSSCNSKIPFKTSTVVPAAVGYVTLKMDNNKNYEIKIEVSNLAEVEKLMPIAHVYVVWIVTEDKSFKNIGGMITTNKLKANFKAVSSFKPYEIMITAEEDANIVTPKGQIVLITDKLWN